MTRATSEYLNRPLRSQAQAIVDHLNRLAALAGYKTVAEVMATQPPKSDPEPAPLPYWVENGQ